MDFSYIFFSGVLICIVALLYVYLAPPKKVELKFINNVSISILYTSCFFLPLTTEVKEYKNLQKAYIKVTSFTRSFSLIYSLFLKFPNITVAVLSNINKEFLSKECDKINDAISNNNNYTITNNDGIERISNVFVILSIIFLVALFMKFNEIEDFLTLGYTAFSSLIFFSISILSSLVVNWHKKLKVTIYN